MSNIWTGCPVIQNIFGHLRDQEPKWIHVTVAEFQGSQSVKIQLSPGRALHKQNVDQLQRLSTGEEEEIQGDTNEEK